MKSFIAMEKRLDVIFAGLQIVEITHRIAEGVCISDGDGVAGFHLVDVDTKNNLRFIGKANLIARLVGGIGGEEQQKAAVEGRCVPWEKKRRIAAIVPPRIAQRPARARKLPGTCERILCKASASSESPRKKCGQ